LSKQYGEIGTFLSDGVVVVPPGSKMRIRGREAYVQSYRDYDQAATTHEFLPGEPEIDVFENAAVAVCPFRIVYESQGKTYREKGRDMLVLSRATGEWRIVWRTMQVETSASDTE
jgi:hypothetical protein